MENFVLALQIITGLFAIYGLCEFIRRIIDIYTINKSGAVCKIVLEECSSDTEYAIRFAQSRFLMGDYGDLFREIEISDNIDKNIKELESLNKEFGNIRF